MSKTLPGDLYTILNSFDNYLVFKNCACFFINFFFQAFNVVVKVDFLIRLVNMLGLDIHTQTQQKK